MDRNEVLEKFKGENDEGVVFAENQGRKLGIFIFGFVAVVLIAIAGFAMPLPLSRAVTDTVLILTATMGVTEYWAKFRFTKQKKYALYTALLAAMFIVSVFRFVSAMTGAI